jgi:transcriptional adapter 2-alpha
MTSSNSSYSDTVKALQSNPKFLWTGGKKVVYVCNYCRSNITTEFRVHCAECDDCDMCADCFSSGAMKAPHKNTHSYRIIDCLDFPVFQKDWTMNEELMLLEGIDKFGVGNWKTIAEYLNTNKTTRQLEEHYWEFYMGQHGECLPSTILSNGQEISIEQVDPNAKTLSNIKVINGYTRIAGTTDATSWTYTKGEGVMRDGNRNTSIDKGHSNNNTQKSKEKSAQDVREHIASLPGADLAGYLPLREDFDIEHENDAELLLADMEFSLDDHPSERELKLHVINIYNKKLQDRIQRKRYAIDRGLVDFKKQQHQDKRRTKEERELVARLRMFAQYHSAEAHDALVEGLIKARRLRQHILLFQQCRKMGIRTLEQVRQYETDRKKRELELKARKARENTPYLFEAEQSMKRGQSSTSSSRRRTGGGDDDDDPYVHGLDAIKKKRKGGADSDINGGGASGGADLSKAPGVSLLSDKEIELCSSMMLLPMHYLAVKEACVREAYRNGRLTLEGMKRVASIDNKGVTGTGEDHESKLYDFFVKESSIVCGANIVNRTSSSSIVASASGSSSGSSPKRQKTE